jgi:hypothetical protein
MRPQLLQRPLRLHTGFVRKTYLGIAGCALFGLAMAIALPAMELQQARELVAAAALWQTGTEAADASVDGRETSHNFILNSYHLNVTYPDDAGELHKGKLEFTSLFASIDQESPAIVKYDPRAPERFALSWMVDMKVSTWAAVALMSAIGIGIGVVMLLAARQLSRKLAGARRAAVESEEGSVPLAQVVEMRQSGRATGVMKYQYDTTDAAGKTKRREVLFNVKKQQAPLYVDQAKSKMFVLRPPAPHQPVVLRNDFYPFDVPEHDRPALLARLERLRSDPDYQS